MDVTVKCPNCNRQVSPKNQYCIYCGYTLSGDSSDIIYPEPPRDMPPPDSEVMPEAYDGPRYCPRGHDVPDPSLGFCPICGSPLVETPSIETASSEGTMTGKSPQPRINRKCRGCGYECDDPDLSFCPSCGIPFESEEVNAPEWKCVCGATNPEDLSFCTSCGKPKGWRLSSVEHSGSEPGHHTVPEGMRPPTEYDLEPKA